MLAEGRAAGTEQGRAEAESFWEWFGGRLRKHRPAAADPAVRQTMAVEVARRVERR